MWMKTFCRVRGCRTTLKDGKKKNEAFVFPARCPGIDSNYHICCGETRGAPSSTEAELNLFVESPHKALKRGTVSETS